MRFSLLHSSRSSSSLLFNISHVPFLGPSLNCFAVGAWVLGWVRRCGCRHACACACACACVCVCMFFVCVCVGKRIHTNASVYIHVCMCAMCIYTCVYVCDVWILIYTYPHICIHIYVCVSVQSGENTTPSWVTYLSKDTRRVGKAAERAAGAHICAFSYTYVCTCM